MEFAESDKFYMQGYTKGLLEAERIVITLINEIDDTTESWPLIKFKNRLAKLIERSK